MIHSVGEIPSFRVNTRVKAAGLLYPTLALTDFTDLPKRNCERVRRLVRISCPGCPRIHLWSCHDGANQVWLRGTSNSFRISNAPNMALDIKDPFWGDGMRAHLWTFHGGKSQRWSWD